MKTEEFYNIYNFAKYDKADVVFTKDHLLDFAEAYKVEYDSEIKAKIDEMIKPLQEAQFCEMERMGDLVIIGELSAKIEVLSELKQWMPK